MPRVIWKGAITFGLVLVPVALYPASQEEDIDFDWLDKRSMDPVGYKRINKRTGRDIDKDNIVKGIKQPDGDYVVVSDDEIKAAYPKTTQTIEIEAFVNAKDIPFTYLEKPYFLEPINKGEKVYALLREAMLEAGVIGVARVVMHSKEHLAALIPSGPALMLNTLRWAGEIRSWDELKLPAEGKSGANLKDAELKMANQLIKDMTQPWKPEDYADQFTDAVMAMVAKKVEAGQTHQVEPLEAAPETEGKSNVLDLTELLKNSLGQRKTRTADTPAAESKPAVKAATKSSAKPASKKTAAVKTAAAKRPARKAA
jgi:DNA end-binding protein Ku